MEVESRNETESDLPGPGRLLGKVFSSVGRLLERSLSSVAEQKGYGPKAIALEIRDKEILRADNERVEKQDLPKQSRNCAKLIRYTGSEVQLLAALLILTMNGVAPRSKKLEHKPWRALSSSPLKVAAYVISS